LTTCRLSWISIDGRSGWKFAFTTKRWDSPNWKLADHRLRWVASGLVYAESRWNRLHGYRHIGVFVAALKAAYQLRLQRQHAALRRQVSAA